MQAQLAAKQSLPLGSIKLRTSQMKLFLKLIRGVNAECDQKHAKMSHSLVISKVTSSFQWESIGTGLIPCFPFTLQFKEYVYIYVYV